MTRNQLSFFATKADLESLLSTVEEKRKLQFVVTGVFDSSEFKSLTSLRDVSNLGVMSNGDPNQEPTYLVADSESQITARMVPQRQGGVKYALDQYVNPMTAIIRLGGEFQDSCLIAGELGTTSDDPNSLRLFNIFRTEIRRQFKKIKSDYVGKEAEERFNLGWRLTGNANSPPLYDLKRD